MHPVRNVTLVILPVLLLLLPGCATQKAYSGPELPDSEIAVIEEGFMGAFAPRVVISAIDDLERDSMAAYMSVKPGTHLLDLNLVSCAGYPVIICTNLASKTLVLDAEAGQAYVVRGKFAAQKPVFWIEEDGSNRIVSGQISQEDIDPAANANSTGVLNTASESVSDDGGAAIEYYGEAEEEIDNGTYDPNLWAKALVEAEGDEQKRKARYIELRAEQLYSEKAGTTSNVNLNKQPVSGNGISGTYSSDITGNLHWVLKTNIPRVKLFQNGKTITGTIGDGRGKIWGEVVGNTVKFEWISSTVSGEGEWLLNPAGSEIVGTYFSSWAGIGTGDWNLTRIE